MHLYTFGAGPAPTTGFYRVKVAVGGGGGGQKWSRGACGIRIPSGK